MYKYYALPLIIFVPLLIVQLTLIPLFSIENIVPDLITILLVVVAINRGQIQGTIYGFVFGLFYDIFTGGLIGSAMFAKTLAGFSAGYFYSESAEDSSGLDIKFIGVIFLCASIDSYFYSILGTTQLSFGFQYFLFDYSVLPGLYTAIVSLPLAGIKKSRISV